MNYATIILQFLILITIIYFYYSNSYFILWLNLGVYLFIKGLQLLYTGGDLFSGFLWIVDYNLGFIFLLFGLHYLRFLHKNDGANVSKMSLVWVSILFTTMYIILNYNTTFVLNSFINVYFITRIVDFYDLFMCQISSNLYIYYLIYFKINVLEFILINIILFLGILIALNLYWNIKLYTVFKYSSSNVNVKKQFFYKQQNPNTQKSTNNLVFKVF